MMNGQGSHRNSSLGNFFVDERPDTNNRGVVQHNVVPANVSVCEQVPANPAVFDGSMLIGWIGQSTSPMNTQNRERVGMVLTNTPVTYHPSILEGAHSGALNGIEQNTASEGNHNDANQGMPAGYLMEETQGREGLSDRRRLTYKRRAPEDAPRQLPLGVSSSSSQQVGNFQLQVAHVQEDAISTPLFNPPNISHPDQFDGRLETGMTRTLSELYRTTTEARQAESFRRNIRMRRALTNPQDIIPPSILSSGTRRYPHLQSPNQSAIRSQFDHLQNLSSATAAPVHAPPPFLSLSYAPDSLQILHPSPWVDVMRSRTTFSSISPAHMQQQWNMRNFPSNISVVPETERRNMVCSPTNLNFAIETADRENMASTSVNVSRSGVHVSAAPTWTQPHLTEQYEDRFSNIVTHSMNESAGFGFEGQDSFHTLHSGAHATRRAMESSVRGGNGRLSQVHHRPGLMTRPDRRDDGPENLPSARSWAVTQRRGRLLSEVQNALALLRGSGTLLGLEDVIIDDSVLFSVPEEHDVHEDMRLDVDNMSYEELLALEDDIGNVCTGLSEETILANLRRQKYRSVSTVSSAGNEPCCICQDEYVDEEDMGKLDCGHNFHFNCIRQWLVHKNSCPICKNTALPVKHN